MPRDKKTEPQQGFLPPEDLPELTPQQKAWFMAYIEGDTATDAYLKAYPTSKTWPRDAVWVEASRMLSHPKVSLWLATARHHAMQGCASSIDEHRSQLRRIRDEAMRTGNIGAAVQAEKALGQVDGHVVERIRNEDTSDSAALADAVEALAPELAAQLRAIGATKH